MYSIIYYNYIINICLKLYIVHDKSVIISEIVGLYTKCKNNKLIIIYTAVCDYTKMLGFPTQPEPVT